MLIHIPLNYRYLNSANVSSQPNTVCPSPNLVPTVPLPVPHLSHLPRSVPPSVPSVRVPPRSVFPGTYHSPTGRPATSFLLLSVLVPSSVPSALVPPPGPVCLGPTPRSRLSWSHPGPVCRTHHQSRFSRSHPGPVCTGLISGPV